MTEEEKMGLEIQLRTIKLEKWVRAGVRKAYPQFPENLVMQGLTVRFKMFEHDQYQTDQCWAELVAEFKAVGHTLD